MRPLAAMIRMRLAALRNSVFNLKKDSVAKTGVIIFGLGNVIALGYWVSLKSFQFIDGFKAFGDLNAKMVALLLFALLILVVLSTVIITYTSVFVAKETTFLFQNPVPHRTILLVKVVESVSIASWASVFLCLPVLVAFGVLREAPPLYYFEMAAVLVVFLLFAGLVGATLSFMLAPLFRRLRPRPLIVGALALLVGLTWIFLRSFELGAMEGENNLLVLDRLTTGLKAMRSPYSPSRWASSAIIAAFEGSHREVFLHGATLLANTLIFVPLLSIYGFRVYQQEWIARQGSLGGRRERRRTRPGRFLSSSPVRALLAKDVIVFLRNSSQLSQSLLFVLLMVIYSLSLLQIPDFFKDAESNPGLFRFIYFANLAAICMILSSFTSRFLFPLLSLEGRAFWILGLAPMSRGRLLFQKVVYGLTISLTLGVMTAVISNIALRSPPDMFASAIYTMCLAAGSLTCLATGLGAAYPSFHEDNPARVAVGLGGTLNFFASALTIAILVAIQSIPHFGATGTWGPRGGLSDNAMFWLFALTHFVATVFAYSVSRFALWLGKRNLERCEF